MSGIWVRPNNPPRVRNRRPLRQLAHAEPVLRRGKISIRAEGRFNRGNLAPSGPALPHGRKTRTRVRELGQVPGRGGVSLGDPPRLGQPDREIQGSQQTLRWREMDSKPSVPGTKEPVFVAEGELRDRTGAAKKGCFLCGTDGSNPSPSSGESGANLIFGDESHR